VDEVVANAREAVKLNLKDAVARDEAMPPPDGVRLETVTVEVPA
jgi:predicted RNase H-like HicB family nuclease